MSTITPTQPTGSTAPAAAPLEEKNYLNHSRGILSWLLTVDHKRIGLMYMISVLVSFFIGGVFAIVLRTELIAQGPTLPVAVQVQATDAEGQMITLPDGAPAMERQWYFPGLTGLPEDPALAAQITNNTWDVYNHYFTLHGAVMVFMFIIPAIPAILGNFVLPIMVGAKDVAFPRLNLFSLYCYWGGGIFFLYILAGGISQGLFGIRLPFAEGLDTGWTFYTPYSTTTNTAVIAATFGAFVLGFSSILTGVNFIATIHMLRPKNMGWFQLPLFLWALYATAIIQILATPVLAITLLLLLAERILGVGIFDPALGGDPILYQHFFWFYSHPAVYIMILPAMGVASEVISCFSRKHIFGYHFIAFSSLAIAVFGFVVWGHHMFTSGQSMMLNTIFSFLTMFVSIPSAVKVWNWLATMYRGRVRLDTPMLYTLGFIWLFAIGGLTGLFLAAITTNIHFHDTYFIVAHFHYVMVGSTLFAFLAGMYYWWPKMFGTMYHEWTGRIGFILVFLGFNITFFIQFIAGSQGMPRRYADFPAEYWIHHFVSTIGSYVLTIGLFLVLFNWIAALLKGRKATANPWGANSLEWHTSSPPPHENFKNDVQGVDPYDFRAWRYDSTTDGYVWDEERARQAAATPLH